MDEILKLINDFHGHIGPYVVLGYRMGRLANKKMGDDPFRKTARVMTGTTPPISCLVDGVQLSSGCTLGKGNIEVEDAGEARVIFTDNEARYLMISLRSDIQDKIETEMTRENAENMAKCLLEFSDEELFEIEEAR